MVGLASGLKRWRAAALLVNPVRPAQKHAPKVSLLDLRMPRERKRKRGSRDLAIDAPRPVSRRKILFVLRFGVFRAFNQLNH